MPWRSEAPLVAIRKPAPARWPDDRRAGPARRGVDGDADRLVDHDDGVVVVDDLDALDDLGDDLERVDQRRDRRRRAPPRAAPGRSCRPPRRRAARGRWRSGRRRGCARARTSGPWRRRRARRRAPRAPAGCGGRRQARVDSARGLAAAVLERAVARVPSSRTPRKTWIRISAAATLMQMSATLKTGQWGSIRKSTTCPRSGPGSRSSRSVRLPATPASSSPSATAQTRLPTRRATTRGRRRPRRWPRS